MENQKLKDVSVDSDGVASHSGHRPRQICDIFVVTLARDPRGENLGTN